MNKSAKTEMRKAATCVAKVFNASNEPVGRFDGAYIYALTGEPIYRVEGLEIYQAGIPKFVGYLENNCVTATNGKLIFVLRS